MLTPGECAALLAAAGAAPNEAPVRLCAMRLLRSEAARIERDHAEAVDFGRGGGVAAAVAPIADWVKSLETVSETEAEDGDGGDDGDAPHRLRLAIEGAAALADMVAAAGGNKALALRLGGVPVLVGCAARGGVGIGTNNARWDRVPICHMKPVRTFTS